MPPRPRAGIALPPGSGLGAGAVLVEAFVVEVNLPALARLEVSPIGEEPHAVSVADILKCLETDQARAIGGAKAACRVEARAEVQETKAAYVQRPKGAPPQAGFSQRQLVRKFAVDVVPVSDTVVSVQFNYSYMRLALEERTPDVPPATDTWNWSSSAVLELGQPQIVAASQSAEQAVFLVLTAHAQGN